jgi:hypothetical protein
MRVNVVSLTAKTCLFAACVGTESRSLLFLIECPCRCSVLKGGRVRGASGEETPARLMKAGSVESRVRDEKEFDGIR